MKAKHLSLAIAALLVAAGLWLARSRFADPRTQPAQKPGMNASLETPLDHSEPGQNRNSRARLAPPNPIRRFRDFTPEQRVEFARKGHGPGG